jgi:hypothetical protein
MKIYFEMSLVEVRRGAPPQAPACLALPKWNVRSIASPCVRNERLERSYLIDRIGQPFTTFQSCCCDYRRPPLLAVKVPTQKCIGQEKSLNRQFDVRNLQLWKSVRHLYFVTSSTAAGLLESFAWPPWPVFPTPFEPPPDAFMPSRA